jgi:predicted enzyme related to lactoylglutathione lyase
VHLDLAVTRDRGATPGEWREDAAGSAARLEARGATVLGPREEMGSYWVVMQDPEGNEFCLH